MGCVCFLHPQGTAQAGLRVAPVLPRGWWSAQVLVGARAWGVGVQGAGAGLCCGEWVLWGPGVLPCLWAPVGLCLRCLWFTFDPVLYICKQL